MNKRGLELIWTTVILIVLAGLLLSFLILFFMRGSGGFFNSVNPYISSSNIDSVVSACNVFSDTKAINKFCCEKMQVKYSFNNTKKELSLSCNELYNQSFVNNQIKYLDCQGIVC